MPIGRQQLPSRARQALFAVLASLLVGGGILFSAGLGGAWMVERAERRSVQSLAAPHLKCAPEEIAVEMQPDSDLEPRYRVSGCGRRGELWCPPQDPGCSFVAP